MNRNLTRRDFLKTTAAAVAATSLQQRSPAAARKAPRPDILVIMSDQMRGDCLSIRNHPAVRTPNLDRLAKQGALFGHAYTTVASCIPARYSLLTGLYPQTSGVVGFKAKRITTPTLPKLLAKAGYFTVLVGRNMHQLPRSRDGGYQKRILGSTYVNNDAYDKFLRKAAPGTGGIRALVRKMKLTFNFWQAKPWPLRNNLHPNEWIVAESRKVVEETDPKQRLFLTASFYAPHPPLFPPKKSFDAHAKQKLPSPAHGDWVDWKSLSRKGDRAGHRVLLEGETLRSAQKGYFGLIEHIDNRIAPLVREFKARSEKAGRPWVIVFIADHGEMLGDHGYFRKCEPYEGASNIPFIVCGSPELGFKPGLRVDKPVCLEDVMPTLLSLAGAEVPGFLDGVDVVPTLRGEKQEIREYLHCEHAPCYSRRQAYQALTDGRFKYIWRPETGREQLFDLRNDPREERDLSKVESHRTVLEMWRKRLVQRLSGRPEGFTKDGKLIPGRPYRPLNKGTIGERLKNKV